MFRYMVAVTVLACVASPSSATDLTPSEKLGRALFFDSSLSLNGNQSCAFCHDAAMGFTSPHSHFNAAGSVVEGSIMGRFGNRKPPSAAYASPAPVFHHKLEDGDVLFVGGAFLDGRATGHAVGNPAADQAQGPFLNPAEMALPHKACVVRKACSPEDPSAYPVSLTDVWGNEVCEISFPTGLAKQCATQDAKITIADKETSDKIDLAYDRIALSIAAFEASREVNRFNSKFDRYLAGKVTLTAQEALGLDVFKEKGKCAECHILTPGPRGEPPLFTDFTYDNLGVPRNPENPWYTQAKFNPAGKAYVDPGLGGHLANAPLYDALAATQMGKHKVSTLRNVDKRISPDTPKAFMHNGYFKTLLGVVKFYNKRDVWQRCDSDWVAEAEALKRKCWPGPEVKANVNTDEMGDLGLSDTEEAALVAFMKTLTDDR